MMKILLLFLFASATVQAQWFYQEGGTTERLRAVSAVNDSIVWASGNHGTFTRTTDGGRSWIASHVAGGDSLDFRDIEAFDANTVYLLSIGPGKRSRIYKSIDGGSSWILQFAGSDAKLFLDEFAFWDSMNGMAVGDEIDGHLFLMRTTDGGLHWSQITPASIPKARPGEGAFAASGSGITVEGTSNVWIGTGVKTARVFRSTDRGQTWNVAVTPLMNENETSGIFSVAFCGAKKGIVVGGDYQKVSATHANVALSNDGGITWKLAPGSPPAGFRSAVIYVSCDYLITVGPSGTDFSTDGGKSWKQIDMIGYHAVGRARDGKGIWAVGEGGRIGHYVDLIVR